MKTNGRILPALALLGSMVTAAPAAAQSFPTATSDRWVAFPCNGGPMVDAVRDHLAFVDERDVVGNAAEPAGFRAVDADFLYLRLRVENDPLLGGQLRRSVWGFAFSTTGLRVTPNILVTLDGVSAEVAVYRNTATTVPGSPTDPADTPAVAAFPFSTHGRVLAAASSNFGGDGDHFIDLAVPWATLRPLGLTPEQAIVVWAASSSAGDRLDGDFACHDSLGGATPPGLDDSASGSTTASGGAPPGGGAGGAGGGSAGPTGPSLEGGPDCAYAGAPDPASVPGLWLLMAAALAIGALTAARDRSRPTR